MPLARAVGVAHTRRDSLQLEPGSTGAYLAKAMLDCQRRLRAAAKVPQSALHAAEDHPIPQSPTVVWCPNERRGWASWAASRGWEEGIRERWQVQDSEERRPSHVMLLTMPLSSRDRADYHSIHRIHCSNLSMSVRAQSGALSVPCMYCMYATSHKPAK